MVRQSETILPFSPASNMQNLKCVIFKRDVFLFFQEYIVLDFLSRTFPYHFVIY